MKFVVIREPSAASMEAIMAMFSGRDLTKSVYMYIHLICELRRLKSNR